MHQVPPEIYFTKFGAEL